MLTRLADLDQVSLGSNLTITNQSVGVAQESRGLRKFLSILARGVYIQLPPYSR